jgi:hypothetical protein
MGLLNWIMYGKKSNQEEEIDPASICSAEDYELFINYLRSGAHRKFSQPGRSIKEEFRFWLEDHTKNQAAGTYHPGREFAA